MLFGPDERPRVLAGEVTLVHRRWRSQLVYPGRDKSPSTRGARQELATQADLTVDELADLQARLARLDRVSAHGPWTRTTLELIAAKPATRAADLAAHLGRETAPFKLDVRKLKNLGLTFSLEVGYRLAPRGETYLRWLS